MALVALLGCATHAPPHMTVATSAPSNPQSEPAPEPDLLHCPLHVETYELGGAHAETPSAPVAVRDGFVVAYDVSDEHGRRTVMTQHVDARGAVAAPMFAGDGRTSPPVLVASSRGPVVLVEGASDVPMSLALDAAGAPRAKARVSLPDAAAWPDDVAAGPRGLVATYLLAGSRVVARRGSEARFPASMSYPMPIEQVVASGPSADVVLLRDTRFSVGVVARSGPPKTLDLQAPMFTDASIAAGPSGFVVVGDGPDIQHLTVVPLAPDGAPAPLVELPRVADAKVVRFPRAAALPHGGWVVTYWDGIGPSLVRLDGALHAIDAPIELRTGDERGGQTEARIAVTARAIAVTWVVGTPWFGHGVASEAPDRPGPRLAVLTCALP